MLNDNKTKYYYEDCHFYFWFNGRHSSEFKLFMQAKNDLKIENTTSPSTEYNNAMFQEGSYFLGTSRKQKTFKRKLAAEGLTQAQYKEMMLWLKEGTTGFLAFDTNPYWGWTVVLETVSDANVFYAHNDMIVEFDVTGKTVGSWLATNKYDATVVDDATLVEGTNTNTQQKEIVADNEWGIPSAMVYYTVDNDLLSVQCDVLGVCNSLLIIWLEIQKRNKKQIQITM